jgi:hypothetical protein
VIWRKQIHSQNSIRGRDWMGTLDLSLSRTMQQPRWLLNASSFRRMHTIACRPAFSMLPPPVPSTQGTAATSFRTTSLALPCLVLSCRSPKSKSHAHPARGKFRRLHIYRRSRRSRSCFIRISKLGAAFSTPAKLFQFSIQTYTALFYLAGKRNRLAGRELN